MVRESVKQCLADDMRMLFFCDLALKEPGRAVGGGGAIALFYLSLDMMA